MKLKRNGSVAVMALIMSTSMAVLAVMVMMLSTDTRIRVRREESDRQVEMAFEGGVALAEDKAMRGVLTLPQNVSTTINGIVVSMDLSVSTFQSVNVRGASFTPLAPSILVNATVTSNGRTYSLKKVIGRGLVSTIWQHALFSDSSVTSGKIVVTGAPGHEGNVWINGTLNLTHASTVIKGNVTATWSLLPINLNVTGTKTAPALPIAFPTISTLDYKNVANTTLPNDATVNGFIFPSAGSGGYPVVYVDGDASIRGHFPTSGVICTKWDADIDGDITTGAGAHLLIIAGVDVDIDNSAKEVDAYIYAAGRFRTKSSSSSRTVLSGVIANETEFECNTVIGFDPWVRDNPVEAQKMKFPGFWP